MTKRLGTMYKVLHSFTLACLLSTGLNPANLLAAPATLLFEEDFNGGIPGWTAVQPPGNYIDGPMRWQYDLVNQAFFETSNIYTDGAGAAPSATAVMLINSASAGTNFTYTARLTAGDDDAFGLIFGYANPTNFFRVTFARQLRTGNGFPWNGWNVDRKINDAVTNLFGDGVDGITDPPADFVNTQYVPFDVTISVMNGLFSLTVVDDPTGLIGGPTEWRLVEAQPLSGLPATGKVGLFTWGQSGTALPGFRIQNLNLSPTPLAGNLDLLPRWTPLVPPSSDGTGLETTTLLNDGLRNEHLANWSLAVDINGPVGTLNENSNALNSNDADGQVDFTAASIVAGEDSWTNYLMTARIIPGDDDGHGILIRFKDELNYYRVALRSQTSGSGVREGLSIQKVVNGVFEEIYHDDPVRFDPPTNVPYDISALIIGQRLQVQVIADPLGAAQVYNYGPFEINGATVPSGKIGFFSWAMYPATQIDFVRVSGIDGIPLQVTSAFGSPTPPAGLNGFEPGAVVNASVGSPVEEIPGVRRVVTGWKGTGSVPASGTATNLTFTMNELSELTWIWRTEVRLSVTAGAGGTTDAPSTEWLPEGTNVSLTATPNPGFLFAGWSGAVAYGTPTLSFTLDHPITLQANFEADNDNDQLPDGWEQRYFGNLDATASADPDQDGATNAEELRRGTNPNFAEMVLDDPLSSRWINVQRNPAVPGQLVVRDWGMGFRGVWENSNDYTEADTDPFLPPEQRLANVSYEGPRIIIQTNVWQNSWSNFTAQAIFSFGDNDGACGYFRYQNESNWYRVTAVADTATASWRAPYGITVQKRTDGYFSELAYTGALPLAPTDDINTGYKRIRITVTADGPNFTVTATPWEVLVTPPIWDTSAEVTLPFFDEDHPTGRFGVGSWGQSGGSTATPSNPVASGLLIEGVTVSVNGAQVFSEDWNNVPLAAELPAGWTNPFTGNTQLDGAWQITAHGTILQTSNDNSPSTATLVEPRGDGEGPVLLAPAPVTPNYFLQLGFHPFDDDGIGFVYDFRDTNNYSKVIFVSEGSNNGRIPQGVTVSRKAGGVWTDIFAGDTSFIYTNGSPFSVDFANNNGFYTLHAWQVDDPSASQTWTWTGPAAAEGNRYGLATWGESDAHFTRARASSLATLASPGVPQITSVTVSGGNVVLGIDIPDGATYAVERSTTLLPSSWTEVAAGQTAATWTTPLPQGSGAAFWRLRSN